MTPETCPTPTRAKTTTIPAVTGDFCPACGEVVLNREHGDRYGELVGQLHGLRARLKAAEAPAKELRDENTGH